MGGEGSPSMAPAFPRSIFMSAGVAQLVGSLVLVLHMSVTCVQKFCQDRGLQAGSGHL